MRIFKLLNNYFIFSIVLLPIALYAQDGAGNPPPKTPVKDNSSKSNNTSKSVSKKRVPKKTTAKTSIKNRRTQSPSQSYYSVEDILNNRLEKNIKDFEDNGGQTLTADVFNLKANEAAEYPLTQFISGNSYYIYSDCENSCDNLSIELIDTKENTVWTTNIDFYNEAGQRISDVITQYSPLRDDVLKVRVTMDSCSKDFCYFSLGVFEN